MNSLVLGFQIAVLMVGGILGGIGLGYLADKHFNILPWGIIIGTIIGLFVSSAAIFQIIKNK